jgi:hypothetical protein
MKGNEPASVGEKASENNGTSESEVAGDSLLLYFLGCGIFWRSEGQSDTLRELMLGLHHVDPLIRCIASQMLSLAHYDWIAA